MEVAATMVPAAEVVPVATATMTAAVVAAAVTSTTTTPVAAFRDREVRDCQRRCENNGGNSHCDP